MSHEIAKLLLEKAETFLKRADAVKAALELGMPLREIEAYLDWLDQCRAQSLRRNPRASRELAPQELAPQELAPQELAPQELAPKTRRVPAALPAAVPAPPTAPQPTLASRTGT